jgi:thymidylate kinase
MKQKPMFICITGIDGVGKTTHVNLILEHLRKKGIKCEYKWLRFHHYLSLPLLAFCRVAGYTKVSTLGGTQKCSYHEFYRSKVVSFIYPWILLADTVILTTFNVYIPMMFGTTIVCDRFVYDTLIDLAVATNNDDIHNKLVGKLFLSLIPQNSKFIMLTLDKSVIISRRNELNDDLTFDERYKLYNNIPAIFNINVVNNNKIVETVNEELINYVGVF